MALIIWECDGQQVRLGEGTPTMWRGREFRAAGADVQYGDGPLDYLRFPHNVVGLCPLEAGLAVTLDNGHRFLLTESGGVGPANWWLRPLDREDPDGAH